MINRMLRQMPAPIAQPNNIDTQRKMENDFIDAVRNGNSGFAVMMARQALQQGSADIIALRFRRATGGSLGQAIQNFPANDRQQLRQLFGDALNN